MPQDSSERELNLDTEILRSGVGQKVKDLLSDERPFFDGRVYGDFSLPASALAEWEGRPAIDQLTEPLSTTEDIQMVLISSEYKGVTETSVQLHITPQGEYSKVGHVYILELTQEKGSELVRYVNKPAPYWPTRKGPAPMITDKISVIKASPEVLRVFDRFLGEAKKLPVEVK